METYANMNFDARNAKLLKPGEHITLDGYPGLRLEANATYRTWLYRYKSPVDGRMRRVKIGHWPALSMHAAVVAWEGLRDRRDAGEDPAAVVKAKRFEARADAAKEAERSSTSAYTVRRLCEDYMREHVTRHRAKKGADEIGRMFSKMLSTVNDLPAASITRSQAFDLIQIYAGDAPVQAGKLRCELGAAWDHALDAGRLSDTTPNWWRLILRGKIRSKGKAISGVKIGTAKRVLSEAETAKLVLWLPNFTRLISDILTMYLWTGTRGAEIAAIQGSEVSEELDGWWWTVPKEKTKNARHENATDLRVPLVGRALEVVWRRKELYGDGPLFPARGVKPIRSIEQKTIQASVFTYQPYSETRPGWIRPRLPVTHWAPHDLRRTVRTILAKIGCRDDVAEAILGHMQPGVKGTYNRHSYDNERRVWITRLSEHIESLVESHR